MNTELTMKTLGETRATNKDYTRNGNMKSFINLSRGISLIGESVVELDAVLEDEIDNFTGKTPRVWWGLLEQKTIVNGKSKLTRTRLDALATVTMLIASKVSLDNETSGNMHYLTIAISRDLGVSLENAFRILVWVVDKSQLFEERAYTKSNKTIKRIYLTEYVTRDIEDAINTKVHFAFYPMPQTEEPVKWDNSIGGYNDYQLSLVRGVKDQVKVPQFALDALNSIQSTKWKVNREVYEQVLNDIKAPVREDIVTAKWCEDGDNKIYFQQSRLFKQEESKYKSTMIALDIASRYLDEDVIYFAHNFDYRGRIYPIAAVFNPQGDDKIKGMLEFADGEKLNDRGVAWCYAYLASLYGYDKKSFDERVELGRDLLHNDYKLADEPYQFLSLQLELKAYELDNNHEVRAHIHIDACASAIQHTSAGVGCSKGLVGSNVLPSDSRQDIYTDMANAADKAITDTACKRVIGDIGRKCGKVVVMLTGYGATDRTMASGIQEAMEGHYNADELSDILDGATSFSVAFTIFKAIKKALNTTLPGTKVFKQWIQSEGKRIANNNQPVKWTTPDGFPITMAPKKLDPKVSKVETTINGVKKKLNIKKELDIIDSRAVCNALSPNYIHSLDACHMRMTINQLPNIKSWGCIHDSFSTLPNHMDDLLQATKDQFIRLYRCNPIHGLAIELESESYPQLDEIDLSNIQDSEYFFA